MKNKIKLFLKWLCTFILCFIIIYLIVFVGGWKLFESGDVILIELGVALVLSFFVFGFIEVVTALEKRVKSLEEQLDEMKNKQ